MKYLGRRLVLHWGESVVALEKLTDVQPSEYGLDKDNPGVLYELFELDGQFLYRPVGKPSKCPIGRTVNEYMSSVECWLTEKELDELITSIRNREPTPHIFLNHLRILFGML